MLYRIYGAYHNDLMNFTYTQIVYICMYVYVCAYVYVECNDNLTKFG